MNKIFLSLLIITLFLTSCANNKDEPSPPEPAIVLTLDNIAGTWEVYYRTRSVNGGEKLRDPNIDGSRITYNANGNFSEINIDGVTEDRGTFKIVGNDIIELTYTTKKGKRLKAGEEIREIYIVELTEKKMTRSNLYKVSSASTSNWVDEVNIYRNIAKISSPNETPDLPQTLQKEIIDINKLMGTWEIDREEIYSYSGNNSTPKLDEPTDNEGIRYRYYIEGGMNKYTESDAEGVLIYSGTFIILDDVVHHFYVDNEGKDATGTIWLKTWTSDSRNFTIADFRHYVDNDNEFIYEGFGKRYTYLKKIE